LTLATFRLYATPRNLFITTLLLIIIVSGAILFMALVGMLSFSDKATKDRWIEITSQILNTCFTINAILLFPSRTVDLWLTMGVLGWVRVGSTSPGTKEEPEDNGPASLPLVNEGRVIAGGDNMAVLPGRASPPSSSSSLWKKFPQSDLHTTPSDSTLTSNTTRPSSATQSALPPGSPAQIPHPVPARIWISIILLQNLTIWFQIPMSISMWVWATDYTNRPAWLVSCSLVASFLCGAAGGVWPFILTWKEKKQDVNH
ncbi:hypothetical protein DFS34DRAFT_564142, partial [Phlyctochytrium arcticum]